MVWSEFLLRPWLPPGRVDQKWPHFLCMATWVVYGHLQNYKSEEWLHPVLCLQSCFLFTGPLVKAPGHSDCASWGWLVGYLWPEGFPRSCQRALLTGHSPSPSRWHAPGSHSFTSTFCSICSQSATTQVLYTWDFLRGSDLTCSHHTHTHRNANYVRSYTHYLPWLWWSFHNVYFYQNIKVYTFNTYNFLPLSVTSQ